MKLIFYMTVLAAIALLWSLIEAQLFKVKTITLKNNKIKQKIKIAFITDIHYGNYFYKSRLRNIVSSVNDLKADIIIIGGDYLDFGKKSKFNRVMLDRLFSELSNLKAKYGILTVLGNHDYYLGKDMKFLLDNLKENNITLLKNETLKIKVNDELIAFHGVDDLLQGKINIDKLQADSSRLNITISHNPDFYEEFHCCYDVGLSGHTHGGQVTLFGLYAPVTESKYGQKYTKTVNKNKNSTIITSKGLGCSMFPIRFCAVPEIVELVIL